jgi:GT2 family glycosyltransferase
VRDYLYKEQMAGGEPFEVDWVPGSCTLVRRDAYRQAGNLPENLFYWSDAVFCRRLRHHGWSVHVVPDATLIHHDGKGTGRKSPSLRHRLIADFHSGAYRFYCEHYSLGPWHPARWLAWAALAVRGRVLIAADSIRNPIRTTNSQGA